MGDGGRAGLTWGNRDVPADCKRLCKNTSILKGDKKEMDVSFFSGAKYKRNKVLSHNAE